MTQMDVPTVRGHFRRVCIVKTLGVSKRRAEVTTASAGVCRHAGPLLGFLLSRPPVFVRQCKDILAGGTGLESVGSIMGIRIMRQGPISTTHPWRRSQV